MTGRVAVIGSINQDIVCEVPTLPGPGETVLAVAARTNVGGKGSNQAVAAVRAGAQVHFIGRIGSDATLPRCREALAGIESTALREVPGARTGTAYVTVASGENQIVVDPAANYRWEPEETLAGMPEAELLAAADVVVAQLEIPLSVAAWAAGRARRFVLNAAPATELDDALLRRCDPLVVNEHELATISGLPTADRDQAARAAHSLCLRGAPAVVATLGAAGSLAARGGTELVYHAAPQVDSVDSTGAGDAFVGALCTGLADGLGLDAAITFATAAAALSVRSPGTHAAYPTRPQILAALADVPRPVSLDLPDPAASPF
ncbi:ribokinase [Nocardia brasiliensis]|uniref:Ribokinase n=1 Tax=Nocardia brasiliensis TaxID=37326 RepID=A0A6G9XQW1_NOCBR|nr:ribokinase [Nocardia brasiliensis]QIS03308.1 ribokinase [Nocardia brasiliensis]